MNSRSCNYTNEHIVANTDKSWLLIRENHLHVSHSAFEKTFFFKECLEVWHFQIQISNKFTSPEIRLDSYLTLRLYKSIHKFEKSFKKVHLKVNVLQSISKFMLQLSGFEPDNAIFFLRLQENFNFSKAKICKS